METSEGVAQCRGDDISQLRGRIPHGLGAVGVQLQDVSQQTEVEGIELAFGLRTRYELDQEHHRRLRWNSQENQSQVGQGTKKINSIRMKEGIEPGG